MSHYHSYIGTVLVNMWFGQNSRLCPSWAFPKKLETAYGMGAATTFVLTIGTGASWIIDHTC